MVHMKKFGLFLSMSLLLAFTGCEKDTVEEPGLPTVSKPVIAVKENTPTSFCVEWDAVEGAEEYLYSVSKNDAEGSMTEVRPETRTAATLFTIDDASAATRYTVRVKTIAAADSQLGDSDFAEIFLETPAEGNSVQAFTFGSLSVTYSSVTVTVTPSQAEESYYAAPVKTSLLIGKNSNDIVKMVKDDITEASLKKGVQEFVFEQLDPSTNYTVVAFGYDWEKGVSTSQLSRSEEIGTTPDQRASLDLSVLSTGDTSISAKCIPSDGEVSYYMTVLPATAFAGKNDYTVLDEQIATLNKQSWDAIAGQLRKGTSTYTASSLTLGTEYCVVAFGLQKSATGIAEAATRLFKLETATTRPEPIVSVEGIIEDGDDYALSDPTVAGKALFTAVFTPNSATVKYAIGLYSEGILDYTEDEKYLALTGDPGAFVSGPQEQGKYILEWGEKIVVGAVGFDAAGNSGPMYWETFTMTKEEGGDTPGGDEPVERGDASVGMDITLSNGYRGQNIGSPTMIVEFTPSSDCVEYRFMVGMNEGTYEKYGEEGVIGIFEDERYHDEGYWESSKDFSSNGVVYTFYDTVLGQTIESFALAYDAEGRPGKLTMETTTFPSSIADLDQLSRPYPSSSFLHISAPRSKRDFVIRLEPSKTARL